MIAETELEKLNHEFAKALIERVSGYAEPPPKLLISEWAARFRKLSRESSNESGSWRNEKTPYLVGIMDALCNPHCQEVVVQASAQVGKTEGILNILGYYIQHDPSSILVVMPNLDNVQSLSKDRLAPMLRDSEAFRGLVDDPKSRDSSNTISHKIFPGGKLSIVTALSPSGLASRPCRVVLCDEVDRFPASSGGEGDPIKLAMRRQDSFAHNRKFIATSTPTHAQTSRIHKLFTSEISKRHHFHIPCPHCKAFIRLIWEQVTWDNNDSKTARYVCQLCHESFDDAQKERVIKLGKWVCLDPEKDDFRMGFHLSALYSTFMSFEKIVKEYLDARQDAETMKAFTNTILGEVWSDDSESVDNNMLYARREEYQAEAPEGVLCITAACDVQVDRVEVSFVGWGKGKRSWDLDHVKVPGDPTGERVWADVSRQLSRKFQHESGAELWVDLALVDSGYATNDVYNFVRKLSHKRVFAIKGVYGAERPVISAGRRQKQAASSQRISLFIIGVDEAKSLVYEYFRRTDPLEEGYCHFPIKDVYDAEYFRQLTSEKLRIIHKNGYPEKRWIKEDHQPNEALDLRVYNLAAITLLNPVWASLERRVKRLAASSEEAKDETLPRPERIKKEKKSGGYVQSWKY